MLTSAIRSLSCRRALLVAFATALATPLTAGAQTRAFLVRLGADTFAVERFTRTGDRIEGTLVRHLPTTSVLKYTLTLNKDGSVASFEQSTARGDGSPMPATQNGVSTTGLKMTFTGDSVTREVQQNGQANVRRTVVPKGTLPAIGGSWLFYELAVQQAKRDGSGGYQTIGFGLQANAANRKVELRIIGADSAEMVQEGFRTGFKFDRNGQLTRGDASLTTQRFLATPVRDVDVTALANAWAAKEAAAGPAATALSPADTVNAVVDAAHLTITYGRPAVRGREIWGKLVPYDTTWRLGANFATAMKTDKDLEIGGVTVPAGQYTLWLYPTAGQSFLVVNKKTWDAAANRPLWGTGWDPAEDLVRIPLDKHMNLPAAEERLRIFVQGDMLMMHWDKGGYGVRVKAK